MPPRTMSQAAIQALVAAQVAAAIASYETQRHQSEDQVGSSGGIGGNPRPCSYKDFEGCKPVSFYGTGGVIELTRWFEKTESVFAISSCPAESKVKFAACTFMDAALTWWNGHVQVLGLPAANALTWDYQNVYLIRVF
ncbi:hypothetical protein LXL04_031035 [Taraxacum kok-saghyz]